MKSFPTLETKEFLVFVADNSVLGIHRAGYNGIASLIPKRTGNNIFVPTYAGLNFEGISLAGLSPYVHPSGSPFEPRQVNFFAKSGIPPQKTPFIAFLPHFFSPPAEKRTFFTKKSKKNPKKFPKISKILKKMSKKISYPPDLAPSA